MSRAGLWSLMLAVAALACGTSGGNHPPPFPDETGPDAGTTPGPLPAPADLHVDSFGDWGITLTWTAVPGASGYHVYGGTDASNLPLFETQSWISSTFRPVEPGLTYRFRVAALNEAGEGAASSLSHTLPPAAPQNLKVVSGTGSSLDLSWDAVPHADGYVLYTCLATCTKAAETAETHASLTGLTAGKMYVAQVTAKNAAGEGAPSQRVNGTTVPAGPEITSFGGETTNSVQVAYEATDGSDDFVLEVANAESGPFFPAGSTVYPFNHLTATGLHPETTYFLRVTARNSLGASAGAARSYTMGTHPYGTGAAPPTPIGLALAPAAEAIDVTWTGSYDLYTMVNVLAADSEAGPFVPVAGSTGTNLRFSWAHLKPATRYCVALEAVSVRYGGPQFSAPSSPVCATTLASP